MLLFSLNYCYSPLVLSPIVLQVDAKISVNADVTAGAAAGIRTGMTGQWGFTRGIEMKNLMDRPDYSGTDTDFKPVFPSPVVRSTAPNVRATVSIPISLTFTVGCCGEIITERWVRV